MVQKKYMLTTRETCLISQQSLKHYFLRKKTTVYNLHKKFTSFLSMIVTLSFLIMTTLYSEGFLFVAKVLATPGVQLPPQIYPRALINPSPIAPYGPSKPISQCYASGPPTPASTQYPTAAQMLLDYQKAWIYGKGAGQRIAIIDTGVAPSPRLPHLFPGGDYVTNPNTARGDQWIGITSQQRFDGLWDCDAHGSAIAGIIGARPSSYDSLVGVAPDATLISIRQYSATFSRPDKAVYPDNFMGADPQKTYGPTVTLAQSILQATILGATIILIPTPECFPVGALKFLRDQRYLGAAIYYAYSRNVLIIAGSGAVGNNYKYCKNNNIADTIAFNTTDKRAWHNLNTIASPNYFHNYVLTVAATSTNSKRYASPLESDLYGPWVGVAAPGDGIISLSSSGKGLSAGRGARVGQKIPYIGSDFAAAYVTGVAALLRQHYPQATPREIMLRLMLTAHHPATSGESRNNAVGYGIIDPLAALTDAVNFQGRRYDPNKDRIAAERPLSPRHNYSAFYAALATFLIITILAIAVFLFTMPLRAKVREQQSKEHEEFSPSIVEFDHEPLINTPPVDLE